ncbi:DNA repair protein RecO, partial [Dissostichus eleginoides]
CLSEAPDAPSLILIKRQRYAERDLNRGPPLGLVWTRSAGHGASIGVARPMLTVPGSEGERGIGVRRGGGLK